MADIVNDCKMNPATFFEKLASCARIDPVTEEIYLNVYCYSVDCEDAESPLACDYPPTDHEQYCADNYFTTDSCGHLALKINWCDKELDQI